MQSRLLLVLLASVSLVVLPGFAEDSTLHPEDRPVEGRDVTLKCRIKGFTALEPGRTVTFQWTKNGIGIGRTYTDTLTIRNATLDDDGVYGCSVRNDGSFPEVSVDNPTYTLILKVLPVVSIAQKRGDAPLTVPEGGTLTLTCQVTNNPKPPVSEAGYTWTFQRRGGSVEDLLQRSRFFTLPSAHRGQSGRYSCSAARDGHFSGLPASSSSVLVLVQYLDSHVTLLPKEEQTVVAGDKVNLTCQVDSVPTATLTWLHQGRVLHKVEGNEAVLSFPATGCQDSGVLQCRADNSALNTSGLAVTHLAVLCPPSIAGGSMQTRIWGRVGETVTLAVQVSANPAPTYMWSGPDLDRGHRSVNLTLTSLETRHSGVYSVTVSNRLGSLAHIFLLNVTSPESQARTHTEHTTTLKPRLDTTEGLAQLELKVGGGVAASTLCLLALLVIYCRRKSCQGSTVKRGASADDGQGQQDWELQAAEESTGDYCSIDYADLDCQPQPDLSSGQDTPELSYDVPPPAVRVTSLGSWVSGDDKLITAVDTTAADDIVGGSTSDESQDSDSYLACHVVSQGLAYDSLTPHSPDPPTQYLTLHSPNPMTQFLTPHSPDPSTQYLTPHSPDPSTQYLTPHSPDPSTQYLTPHSPDPTTQYLTPNSPNPTSQYLTPLHPDRSSRRGSESSDVRDYVIPELD